jgi:hypothetical protein
VEFVILNVLAPLEVLRARIAERKARSTDASEADLAVLERQVAVREPLTPAEMAAAFTVDGTRPVAPETWTPFIERVRMLQGRSRRTARLPDAGAPLIPSETEESEPAGTRSPLWQ